MVSNILFDLDGTLTDPKEGITKCIQYALKRLGQPDKSEVNLPNLIGPPLHTIFTNILGTSDHNLIKRAVTLYRERFSEVGLFENRVYPGIMELLSVLNKNSYKLYVVTVKPKVFAERIVRHFSFGRWLEAVFGSALSDTEDSKLKLVESILTELKLIPEDTALVGDRKEDIIAGRLNGTITIGVTYGYGGIDEIVDSGPDYICKSPYEIKQAILNHTS